MSNTTQRLLRSRHVKSSYCNNIISLDAVKTATRSQYYDRLPLTWTRARRFHHSGQFPTPSTLESTNGREVGINTGASNSTPLSILPMPVLLRSLLVSGICSKPYLLRPSLSILSFLCKPNRNFVFNVDRNPFLNWLVKRTFYDQFCVGENAADAKETMKKMHGFGISGIILTYAKETTYDHKSKREQATGSIVQRADITQQKCEEIEAWRAGTLQTVYMTGDGDQIAIKMTGAGASATKAFAAGEFPPKQMMDALDEICQAARQTKARIVIDAESQHFQRGIARTAIMLMRKYNTEKTPLVYHTYQCYLKETRQRLARDLALAAQEGWAIGVKLVRGAYMSTDKRSYIHDTKEETDRAYDSIARDVLRRDMGGFGGSERLGGRPFPQVSVILATHNKNSATAAQKLQQQIIGEGLSVVPLEFAQLHGMADSLSFSLLNTKNSQGESPKVLKCSTWGPMNECLAYLLRRAIENRDAVSRTQDEFNTVKTEFGRRVRSVIGL